MSVLTVSAGRPASSPTVLVVGSGAGGMAAAVDLAIDGWDVLITDPYEMHVPAAGIVNFQGPAGSGSVTLKQAGIPLDDAVRRASLVVVATLTTAVADVISLLAPSLQRGQTVVAACGGLVSLALEHARGADSDLLIGELACFPYSSRFRPDGSLHIRRRRPVRWAATSVYRTAELAKSMPTPWVGQSAASALHAAVLNPNYLVHPAAVVTNAASRDRQERVPHEGLTEGARRIVGALDRDKCALLGALGLPEVTLAQMMEEMDQGGSKSPTADQDPPEPILERYLTEDCGMGLSLLAELANTIGLAVPTITAIRSVLAAALPRELPPFPFELIGDGPSKLTQHREAPIGR